MEDKHFLDFSKIHNEIICTINNYLIPISGCFKSNKDASEFYINFFKYGHLDLHNALGKDYPCQRIDNILIDFFFMYIKYDVRFFDVEIPGIFKNHHAVLLYFRDRDILQELIRKGHFKESIINILSENEYYNNSTELYNFNKLNINFEDITKI